MATVTLLQLSAVDSCILPYYCPCLHFLLMLLKTFDTCLCCCYWLKNYGLLIIFYWKYFFVGPSLGIFEVFYC